MMMKKNTSSSSAHDISLRIQEVWLASLGEQPTLEKAFEAVMISVLDEESRTRVLDATEHLAMLVAAHVQERYALCIQHPMSSAISLVTMLRLEEGGGGGEARTLFVNDDRARPFVFDVDEACFINKDHGRLRLNGGFMEILVRNSRRSPPPLLYRTVFKLLTKGRLDKVNRLLQG